MIKDCSRRICKFRKQIRNKGLLSWQMGSKKNSWIQSSGVGYHVLQEIEKNSKGGASENFKTALACQQSCNPSRDPVPFMGSKSMFDLSIIFYSIHIIGSLSDRGTMFCKLTCFPKYIPFHFQLM
jgi:hypothetical protein